MRIQLEGRTIIYLRTTLETVTQLVTSVKGDFEQADPGSRASAMQGDEKRDDYTLYFTIADRSLEVQDSIHRYLKYRSAHS
jgi:hypothetical protein